MIDKYIEKNNGNKEKGIKEFASKFFSKKTVSLDIVKKLKSITSNKPENPVDNTLSYYFDDNDEVTHASRYVEEMLGHGVDNWTSKLGEGFLIAHDENDLSGDGSLYGQQAIWYSPEESNIKDEL